MRQQRSQRNGSGPTTPPSQGPLPKIDTPHALQDNEPASFSMAPHSCGACDHVAQGWPFIGRPADHSTYWVRTHEPSDSAAKTDNTNQNLSQNDSANFWWNLDRLVGFANGFIELSSRLNEVVLQSLRSLVG